MKPSTFIGDGAFPFHRERFPKLESGEDLNSSSHLRRHFFSDLSQFPPVDVERRVRASRERDRRRPRDWYRKLAGKWDGRS